MRIFNYYSWVRTLIKLETDRQSIKNKPWASGGILLVCVIIAMLLANLPFTRNLYHEFLETSLSMSIQSPDRSIDWIFPQDLTIEKFINDILMVIFFFTVGLEIKREVVCGELSNTKKAMMPVIAAAGGMLAPAIIFMIFNHGTHGASGWGIPTATDIAFAVGIMSILGNRVPLSLKVFLTALAIADDLGAILVVAFFYGGSINLMLLTISLVLIIAIVIMNRLGEKRMIFYLIPAIAVWFLFYYSGIHATMSGVVMAFLIPMKPRYNQSYMLRKDNSYDHKIETTVLSDDEMFPNTEQRHNLQMKSRVAKQSIGMSYRLEHALNPWVNFIIMPIFALANAGVEIPDLSYFNIFQYSPELGSVGMGIFFGLLLGKPIGITIASYIAIKLKVGAMPSKSTWQSLFAVACLGGIGFTMSIFVDTLSFGDIPQHTEELRSIGKIAVLMGSLCSGILGSILIIILNKKEEN